MTTPPMDEARLTLLQWMSPGFPIGAFAYSQGIEQAAAEEQVTEAATLESWIREALHHGASRADAILLHLAHGSDDLAALDAEARAAAFGAERLRETERQGAAFCHTVSAVWGHDLAGLTYPVALGAAAFRAQIPARDAAAAFLHAAAAAQRAALQRLGRLGQTAAQGVLAALGPDCLHVAAATEGLTLDDLAQSTFAAEIAGLRHETLQPRLFQS